MPRPPSAPTYCHHKATGQARTIINGKTYYLGKYNSPESERKFRELVAEWRLGKSLENFTLLVEDLALKFMDHAKVYYRDKQGQSTRTAENFLNALRPLVRVHGKTPVKEFGPKALKAVRAEMIKSGNARTYINSMIGKIKQVFRWGVEEELVPSGVYEALKSLAWLRAGRSEARETIPVKPVGEETVNDTLPHLPRVVADMVRLQLLSGARPGEVCSMRPCDITREKSGVLCYRPGKHKTEHHGRERRIYIGPEGQKVLAPYLLRDPDAYCFSPAEAEKERNESRRANRRSPMTPSQATRETKGRKLATRYNKNTYCKAIQRGGEIAFEMPYELRYVSRQVARLKLPSKKLQEAEKQRLNKRATEWHEKHCWAPNQLRHSRATAIRERYGIEAAQTVLGHADPKVTEIYAERDFEMAARIMSEIG
jgi:integrase